MRNKGQHVIAYQRIGLAIALAAAAASPVRAADEAAIAPFSAAAPGEPPAGWKFATVPTGRYTRTAGAVRLSQRCSPESPLAATMSFI